MSDTGGRSSTLRVFSLFGYKGSGKTSIARAITRLIPGCKRMSYADRPMNAICSMFDCNRTQLDSTEFRSGEAYPGVSFDHALKTLRHNWGNDIIGVDVWTSLAAKEAARNNADNIVFDDGMYPESESVKMHAFLTKWNERYEKIVFHPIRIHRPDLDDTAHRDSETTLNRMTFHHNFFNRGVSLKGVGKDVATFFKFKMKLEDFQ
jgi:hypothetical protein